MLTQSYHQLAAMILPVIYCYKLVNAGGGKHVYDVTYWELANHQAVSSSCSELLFLLHRPCRGPLAKNLARWPR